MLEAQRWMIVCMRLYRIVGVRSQLCPCSHRAVSDGWTILSQWLADIERDMPRTPFIRRFLAGVVDPIWKVLLATEALCQAG